MNGTERWLSFLENLGGGELLIYLEGCLVPDLSFSSLYVIHGLPSMLSSYLSTTSSLLPLLFLCLHSVIWRISLIVPVPGGEFSADSCNIRRLSCLEVTKWLGENGRNFLCHVCATQPIGIFLPPPGRESTQLCGFGILPPSRNSTQLCGFCGSLSGYGPCSGSPPFPPTSPHRLAQHCLDGWSAATECAATKY